MMETEKKEEKKEEKNLSPAQTKTRKQQEKFSNPGKENQQPSKTNS